MIVEILQVGSPVYIGDDIAGKIVAIIIRDNMYVQYQVSWWDGRSHKQEWLELCDVKRTKDTQSIKIGFN